MKLLLTIGLTVLGVVGLVVGVCGGLVAINALFTLRANAGVLLIALPLLVAGLLLYRFSQRRLHAINHPDGTHE